MSPLRVLIVASEVAPVAKTGGLADVVAALGIELGRKGHDVHVLVPLYRRVREGVADLEPVPGLQGLRIDMGPHTYRVSVVRGTVGGLVVDFLDCPALYDRPGIYTPDRDEHLRFALLSRAALSVCQELGWAPDIVHCNDWHTGLLPLYLKLLSSWEQLFDSTKTVLTIHNIGYQGMFAAEVVHELGLDDARHLLHQEDLAEGRVNLLKTGLIYADVLTTVSRTYAREIQGEELGMGLQEMLRGRDDHLVGIVNGVDYGEWSPEQDRYIPQHYSAETIDGKLENKRALLAVAGLPPGDACMTFGVVSRLVTQKGFSILFEPLSEMLAHHDVRLVVLGSGEPAIEDFFAGLAHRFPQRCAYDKGYNDPLAHLIEAGADAFLMPSRYEPCGLNQMYSLRYGTVPIVRRTGGLADTVELFDPETGEGTGIVFDDFNAEAARWALSVALKLYHQPRLWRRMMLNGMARDFSWTRQAGTYVELYHRLLGREVPAA